MNFNTPPYLIQNVSVQHVMLQVLVALVPGIAAYAWLIGPIILVQIAIATVAAVLAEAVMLKLVNKPVGLFLGDGSAVVTGWLIALAFRRWLRGGWSSSVPCSPLSWPNTSTAGLGRIPSTRR